MIQLVKDNPIYLVKNFCVPIFQKKKIIQKVLDNRKLSNLPETDFNYQIKEDYNNFFKNLYSKFYKFCEKNFVFTKHPSSISECWAYSSTKDDFKEVWHDHLKTSTINGVYYLNIPKNDNVTIDFLLKDGSIYTYKINNHDLLIFPNYLKHKPNKCHKDGHRISINMEIICNEHSIQIF